MKKLVFLRQNPEAKGGAESYLKWLKSSFEILGLSSEIRGFKGNKSLASWIKALLFNKEARKRKAPDELYFSLARIDSSDIYRTDDGVHKVYRKSKKFWWLNPLNFTLPYLEKKCFNNAKCVIAISQMVKNDIIKNYKIDEKKIELIYNGIENPSPKINKQKAKNELCAKLNLDSSLPLILFVGSGFKRKGVGEILDILELIKLPFNAIFVGGDKKLEKYKKRAQKIGKNVIFTGFVTQPKIYFESSDIFIALPSYEPFSLAALEAMSYANSVILNQNCGASELLDPSLVASDKLHAIATLNLLLASKEIRQKIGEQNRQKAKDFSLETSAKKMLEITKRFL